MEELDMAEQTSLRAKFKTALKSWDREAIKEKLETDPRWVERGIVAIFKQQTDDEKQTFSTRHHNSRGFNSWAAGSGTYMANWIISGRRLNTKFLAKAKKICLAHVAQLTKIANGELERL